MIADSKNAPTARLEPVEAVRRFNTLWVEANIDGAMQLVAEHAIYNLYISEDLLPVGGQTVGRANIEAALRAVRQQFEYVLYRPRDLMLSGQDVRHQVEFMYRHRSSGELLSGRLRMIMRVEDGLITRADEYHDRAKVEAFLRLFCN